MKLECIRDDSPYSIDIYHDATYNTFRGLSLRILHHTRPLPCVSPFATESSRRLKALAGWGLIVWASAGGPSLRAAEGDHHRHILPIHLSSTSQAHESPGRPIT